jgi:membrane protein DedA with SNARE-associated domain
LAAEIAENLYFSAMEPYHPQLHELAHYLHAVSPYLDKYGYWAIFFGVLLEDFGIPAPGETLLISGGLLAAMGTLRVEWVVLLGFSSAVIGDNIGYAIGLFCGRPFVLKYGSFVFLSEERLLKVETFFGRYGGRIVTVARFIEGLRQVNGIVAGISRMPWLHFLLFNMLGAALWVGAWVGGVYLLGHEPATVFKVFNRFRTYLLAGLIAALFLLIIYLFIKKLNNSTRSRY